MTYIDRGRAAHDQGMINKIGSTFSAKQLPDSTNNKSVPTPSKAVFGVASDLDFVLQLVDRMEALHEENPDADISLNIDEKCKASLVEATTSSNP